MDPSSNSVRNVYYFALRVLVWLQTFETVYFCIYHELKASLNVLSKSNTFTLLIVPSANKYSLEKVKCSMLKRVVDFINRIKYFYLEKFTKSFSLKNISDSFDTRCRSSLIFKFLNRMNFMACICFVCYVIQIHVYS